ncbi:MAG TPA: hypothetical protein VGE76_16325 [Opitutaceae bacterium]
MNDAFLLFLGGLLGAYTNLVTSTYLNFRAQKAAAFSNFVALTTPESLRALILNNRAVSSSMQHVCVVLLTDGHTKACDELGELAKTIQERLCEILVTPLPETMAIQDHTHRFLVGARLVLAERKDSWPAAIAELKPNWAAIFWPFR